MRKARPYTKANKKRIGPSSVIEWVDNPVPTLAQVIDFRVPEFSHSCPITGEPDVAVMNIRFIPRDKLIETKSLLRYLWTFRGIEMFHEEVGPIVLRDIVNALDPRWAQVLGEYTVRGVTSERTLVEYVAKDLTLEERSVANLNRFRL